MKPRRILPITYGLHHGITAHAWDTELTIKTAGGVSKTVTKENTHG